MLGIEGRTGHAMGGNTGAVVSGGSQMGQAPMRRRTENGQPRSHRDEDDHTTAGSLPGHLLHARPGPETLPVSTPLGPTAAPQAGRCLPAVKRRMPRTGRLRGFPKSTQTPGGRPSS